MADDRRELLGTSLVRLELVPAAVQANDLEQLRYLGTIWGLIRWVSINEEHIDTAVKLGCDNNVTGLDALHVAAALHGGAQEFVTTEREGKPLYRISGLTVVHLLQASM